jgi:hypothetical protein
MYILALKVLLTLKIYVTILSRPSSQRQSFEFSSQKYLLHLMIVLRTLKDRLNIFLAPKPITIIRSLCTVLRNVSGVIYNTHSRKITNNKQAEVATNKPIIVPTVRYGK